MPSDKTPGFERKPKGAGRASAGKTEEVGANILNLGGSENRDERHFESDLAMDIIGELYPLLLENCTDEDEEVDTQAVFEVLAGMVGLFMADYQEFYGHEKAMGAMQDLIDLSLNLYEERVGGEEGE